MPETPDFEKVAATIISGLPDLADELLAPIIEQLRLVWNARGAADITLVESELALYMGSQASGPYAKNLDRALRKLDR